MSVQTFQIEGGVSSLVDAAAQRLPPAPKTIEETGLDSTFLVELAAKVMFLHGQSSLADLCHELRLPASVLESLLAFMRGERLVEVVRRGAAEGDVHYQLTDTGRSRAAGFLERRGYAGAAPVSLQAYCDMVEAQSVADVHVTSEEVHRAFADQVLSPRLLDQVGAAMNSGRAMFLYGPAGSGKTYLAERLRRLMHGDIVLPYAINVGSEVIQVFDPIVHEPVAEPAAADGSFERSVVSDLRWIRCRRPVVLSGGELRLSMLDLDFDEATGYYQAPPHVKANNGIYVVDDLGRQQVAVRDLLNRWIVPLDRRIDYLSLRTGHKFKVPFDVVVVFSTNLNPSDLVDEAFLRRIGHKIRFAPMAEADYRAVFCNVCAEYGIPFSEPMFARLLRDYHAANGKPLLACYPRDLLSQVRDFALYEGVAPTLTAEALDRAWHNYFIEE
jgi:energy-coupling factor transporter ATP-binding protein EcfA2